MALFHYLCFTRKISIPFSSVISQHRCHAGSGTEGNILTCSVPAAASSPRIPTEHPGTVLHSSTMGRVLCLPPYFPYKPTRQEITGLLELFERSWFFTKWKIKGQQHEPGLLLAMGAAGVYRTKEKQRVITAKPSLHCHTQWHTQLLTDSYLGLFFDCFRHSLKQLSSFQSNNIFSSSFGKFMFSGTCWTILSQQGSRREKYILNRSEKK